MLSRNNVSSEEWMLHPLTVERIWEVFGRARVDLFASEDNSHCPIFFTKSTDVLAHEWPSLPLYAFLPVALLPQLLRWVRKQLHKLILIAHLWRNQPWVSELFQLLKAAPCPIPLRWDLLSQQRPSSTIEVYVAAIVAFHAPIAGRLVGRDSAVTQFLQCTKRRKPCVLVQFHLGTYQPY